MKRFFALFLTIVLALSLCACGKDASSDSETTLPKEADFTPPEDYATVILISINPQFRLYLDTAGAVLAVEPVNDDAKAIADQVASTGTLEAVVEKIATAAKDGGFVTGTATVDIQVTEVKAEIVNPEALLEKAESAAVDSFQKLEVEAEVSTSVSPEIPAPSDPQQTQPPHTHVYADATCTLPATCACGATEGKALGHSFKDGSCSVCGEKDPNASYTPISAKGGKWKLKFATETTCYDATLYLTGDEPYLSVKLGDALSTFPEDVQDEVKPDCVEFEGNFFYFGGGSGGAFSKIEDGGSTVTVTDDNGNKLTLKRAGENSMEVTASPDTFSALDKVPIGIKVSFSAE